MTTRFVLQEMPESPLRLKNGSTKKIYKTIKLCCKVNIQRNIASCIILMLVSNFDNLYSSHKDNTHRIYTKEKEMKTYQHKN